MEPPKNKFRNGKRAFALVKSSTAAMGSVHGGGLGQASSTALRGRKTLVVESPSKPNFVSSNSSIDRRVSCENSEVCAGPHLVGHAVGGGVPRLHGALSPLILPASHVRDGSCDPNQSAGGRGPVAGRGRNVESVNSWLVEVKFQVKPFRTTSTSVCAHVLLGTFHHRTPDANEWSVSMDRPSMRHQTPVQFNNYRQYLQQTETTCATLTGLAVVIFGGGRNGGRG